MRQQEGIAVSTIFEQFQEYLHQIQRYNQIQVLLYWDMKGQMPKEGFAGHSDALTYFSTEQFKLATSQKLRGYLETLSEPDELEKLDFDWQFIVRRMKRELERDARMPERFVSALVQTQAQAGQAWEEAKRASDFSIFAPHLQKMIDMTKEKCAYTDPGKEVYDVLLNNYEEGMDSATIDRIFGELKEALLPLLQKILAAKQPDDSKFQAFCSADSQRRLQEYLLSYIGFDWNRGAVGESEHPFTLNFSSKDVRVTNHYYENSALFSIFSAIHEGGHAIFEQNVNPKLDGTVAGGCSYMGVHESQSRLYENILGRSRGFWEPIYADVQKILPAFADITLDEFYREVNHVRSSFIRTEADEVTYCFHIMLRYELEKAIFRDGVRVEELPAMWNAKMQEYLQITPGNDAEGILQDMHWSDGSFGYFPSYLLGSIYDGMFLEQLNRELGPVEELLKAGRIREITGWLNEKIHWFGSTRLPKEVIAGVCGREVTAQPLVDYFTEKYTKLYQL